MRLWKIVAIAAAAAGIGALPALHAQDKAGMERVADRQPGEGEGPFRRLVIRGATLIDGTGAPPRGPVDIVVAGNRIESIRGAGTRSEEHTSELQSLAYLVCRLLLEKKKKKKTKKKEIIIQL